MIMIVNDQLPDLGNKNSDDNDSNQSDSLVIIAL